MWTACYRTRGSSISKLTPLPYTVARWLEPDFDASLFRYSETQLVEDRDGRPVVLAKSLWYLDRLQQKHPELVLRMTAG